MSEAHALDATAEAAADELPSAGVTRLQVVVYSAMVAFFILAGYGFYLIYSLTKDVNGLARNVMSMTETMDVTMHSIAKTMTDISDKMTAINASTEKLSVSTQRMTDQMSTVANSAQNMAVSTDHMRYDVRRLNNSVSGPLDAMTSFMPFSRAENPPPNPGGPYAMPPMGMPYPAAPASGPSAPVVGPTSATSDRVNVVTYLTR